MKKIFAISILLLNLSLLHAQISPNANNTLFVNTNVSGGNGNGGSWANATPQLRDVLYWAFNNWNTSVNGVLTIWVAKGTYTPSGNGDVSASFMVPGKIDGVKIYGGFTGNETALSQRNPAANTTILSGDLNNDDADTDSDGLEEANRSDNSNHVIYIDGTSNKITAATTIDGFTITGGNGTSGSGIWCNGAGLACSPTLTQINFTQNINTSFGGAIYNNGSNSGQSNTTIKNCKFTYNRAENGGAIYNDAFSNGESSPLISNCIFNHNASTNTNPNINGNGGAIYNGGDDTGISNPILKNLVFMNNHSNRDGGAVFNDGSNSGDCHATLINCLFVNNDADYNGGAVINLGYNGTCSPKFVNCTFYGNTSGYDGGAMINDVTTSNTNGTTATEIHNTIFYGNNATNSGDAIYNRGDGANIKVDFSLFSNTNAVANTSSSTTTYLDGSGNSQSFANSSNIQGDPQFIDVTNPKGTDAQLGTPDDGFELSNSSSAIGAGDNATYNNFGNLTTDVDLAGQSRKGCGTIDMGAYESHADIQPQITATSSTLTADVTGNNTTFQWIDCSTQQPISGATNQSYQLTANGSFAVIVTRGNCIDTSACFNVNNLGVSSQELNTVKVFPNPSNEQINIQFNTTEEGAANLYDLNGKLINNITFHGANIKINTRNLSPGLYILKLKIGQRSTQKKVVINH